MPYTDETGQKAGTAKFAIRFCGGGYLHGTPINVQEEVNKEFFLKTKRNSLWEHILELENVLEQVKDTQNSYLIG